MKYKLLGRSGVRVSEFALGTMTLSKTNPWDWGVPTEESLEILETFYEAGGNYIDTANNYTNGESEEIIGQFMAERDRDEFVIASKFTLHNNDYGENPNFGGNSRKNIIRSLNASLDRLQTDYLDILYLHVWDYTTGIKEVMKTLNSLVDQMKINYIGISDSPVWVAAQANTMAQERGWEEFTTYQFPFNIGSQDPKHEVIPFSRYNDLALAPWSVLGAGLYTGKYTKNGENDNSDVKGRIANSDQPEHKLKIAREIDTIADELDVSSVAVTVAWTKQVDPRMIPILGATKSEHTQMVIDGLDVELDSDHISRLDEVADFTKQFPQSFTSSQNVLNLIHGDTYENLENHRFNGY